MPRSTSPGTSTGRPAAVSSVRNSLITMAGCDGDGGSQDEALLHPLATDLMMPKGTSGGSTGWRRLWLQGAQVAPASDRRPPRNPIESCGSAQQTQSGQAL